MIRDPKITDPMPEQIGKNKIIDRLGKGGMGDIYKAIQEPLNRVVAVKVLPPALSRDDEFSKRFEIEAKAISLLQHQNIVSIYEYGEDNGYSYFAMQFVDGENLAQLITRSKNLPVVDAINYSKQICRGLRYAHSKGIVHRDIKPQNILIDKNGVVHISDFGIAKMMSSVNITMTGLTVGTPEYMSPEQAEGQALDGQTDIYSLGILMYEMLTRNPPFTGDNPMAIAYKQVNELPAPPSLKRKDIPKRLELVILKALKKNKKERYTTVEEMLEHLDSVDLDERVESPTVSLKTKHHHHDTSKNGKVSDKRITDRRSGERRHGHFHSDHEGSFLLSKDYWVDMVRIHWLTWLLFGVLGVVVGVHLFT